MLKYPAALAKAQVELDAVIGSTRLPVFADRPHIAYLEAVVLEALRWVPALSMGLPHATTADDEYRGYLIPKNTTVLYNAWRVRSCFKETRPCTHSSKLLNRAILHDPETYPDPEAFKPERFLKEVDGKLELDPSVPDPRVAAFGAGRR
jgi:cytochrome P450